MRVMTVRQPWAWAIVRGGKDVENRVRNIAGNYRGPVAIHAGLEWDDDAPFDPLIDEAFTNRNMWATELDRGAIIGVVDLADVHGVMMTDGRWHCEHIQPPTDPGEAGGCSRWAHLGSLHLSLANPRSLSEPIPFRGALGLRTLPADVEALIEQGLAR